MKQFTIPSVFTAIDKFTAPVKKMTNSLVAFTKRSAEEVARFERHYRKLGDTAWKVAKQSFIVGSFIAAPLIVAANDAIKFEDRMADVAKTTGLAGKELTAFGQDLLQMAPDTRTSIEELQQIAAIGGQMHVAQNELLGFTDSVNKFNVALGSDFSGGVEGAAKAISGLKILFKETRDMRIDEAITKTGSAINALSAQGVQVPEVTEFISRVGQLPDAIKPSIQDVAALGAVFNKAGITAEIASRAVGDVLLTAAANLPKFAKQMGMTNEAAKNLINTDPAKFLARFSESLKGMDAVKLSATLKSLKLMDSGSIKVVGALGSSTKQLADFQKIANDEFAAGTSLLNEYNVKNNTTKAQLEKAQNNFKALSIIIGTELLPVITSLLIEITPVIKGFATWAKENPGTVKTILLLAVAMSALSYVVAIVSTAVRVWSGIMLIWNNVTKVVTAAQWLWNAAMTANPIGLIIVGIAALIGFVALVIAKWDEWGAAISLFMGPLGFVISLIQSFRRNWDMIVQAFKTGGILGAIKAIGITLLDAVLMPLQQIVGLIANVTGAEWAKNAVAGIEAFRAGLGIDVKGDGESQATADNPKVVQATTNMDIQKQNVQIDINDKTGRADVKSDNDLVPIRLGSTVNPKLAF